MRLPQKYLWLHHQKGHPLILGTQLQVNYLKALRKTRMFLPSLKNLLSKQDREDHRSQSHFSPCGAKK